MKGLRGDDNLFAGTATNVDRHVSLIYTPTLLQTQLSMAKKSLKNIVQNQAYKIVFWQLACVVLIAIIGLIINGINTGLSVFAGGMAYGIANLIFVWRVFRYVGAQQMNQFMAAFMLGEISKLILSGILFIVIVKYLPVSLLSVLIGFIGAIISFWIVCMWQFSRQPAVKKE